MAAFSLIEKIRLTDGLILASPGYHGIISGHVKNALDYIKTLVKTVGHTWRTVRSSL